jgi:Cu(I)/Ag(I) efflux system membrane fusion protein
MAGTWLVFANWDTLWGHYEKWARPSAEPPRVAAGIEYFCPMHPQIVQDGLGSCPICGMPLARRKKGEKATLPAGVTARVELPPFRVRQAGIRTAEVAYAPLNQSVATVGYVGFDERRIAQIVSKVPGKSRVERLLVNVTGQRVEAGQPLGELYSPELFQGIQELLQVARRTGPAAEPKSALGRSLLADRQELLRASSEKLKRWGLRQEQIDEILAKGKTDFSFPILAPIGGFVIKKNVVEGQEVPEGYPMFEVADLRSVWIQARVYEHQLALIREGQAVEATVAAFPGSTFPGKVEFLAPQLDEATRTIEVRYALENLDARLRPGMFATVNVKAPLAELPAYRSKVAVRSRSASSHATRLTVEEQKTCPVTHLKLGSMGEPVAIEVEGHHIWACCPACSPKLKAQPAKYLSRLAPPPADEVLAVPESAVIDTGSRKVVYVESEPGVFEGRAVLLGPRIGDRYPVLDGLDPGERVVAAGAFLIDAESRLSSGTAPAEPIEPDPTEVEERVPRSADASEGSPLKR